MKDNKKNGLKTMDYIYIRSTESVKLHIVERVVESSPKVTRYIQNNFLLCCFKEWILA